jgi:hypothetical protein
MFFASPPHLPSIRSLLSRAGASIPNRIRETVKASDPSTAFAWWISVVLRFSTLSPIPFSVVLNAGNVVKMGLMLTDPLGASLSAIEVAGLVPQQNDDNPTAAGDWSIPMSKTEFARRMLCKPDARARDVSPLWNSFEKVQYAKNTWMFRLDKLPLETRNKLTGGKP